MCPSSRSNNQPFSPINLNLYIVSSNVQEDRLLVDKFEGHISSHIRKGTVNFWHNGKLEAGLEEELEIQKKLDDADIILLMVSRDFLASNKIYNNELPISIHRHENGLSTVVPIILRSVYWQNEPFQKIKCLPDNHKPVVSNFWRDIDEAFLNVITSLEEIFRNKLHQKKCLEYEKALITCVGKYYPLTQESKSLLDDIQKSLDLPIEDISIIQGPILHKEEQEYQKKVDQYRQLFQDKMRRLILSGEQQRKLSSFQKELGILELDASKIQAEYTALDAVVDHYKQLRETLIKIRGVAIAIVILLFFISIARSCKPQKSPVLKRANDIEASKKFVTSYFSAKSQIFGYYSSYDQKLETMQKMIAGNKYVQVDAAVNRMWAERSYIIFHKEPEINYAKQFFFCSLDDYRIEIHLSVDHPYTEHYQDGSIKRTQKQSYDGVFGLMYVAGSWKLVDDGESIDTRSLTDFRHRFWGRDIAAEECYYYPD